MKEIREAFGNCDCCNQLLYEDEPHVEVVRQLCSLHGLAKAVSEMEVMEDDTEVFLCHACDQRVDWAAFSEVFIKWFSLGLAKEKKSGNHSSEDR